jgi:hypothetical protein
LLPWLVWTGANTGMARAFLIDAFDLIAGFPLLPDKWLSSTRLIAALRKPH